MESFKLNSRKLIKCKKYIFLLADCKLLIFLSLFEDVKVAKVPRASVAYPYFREFETQFWGVFVKFSNFLPNFKGLHLLSANFRDLQSLNSAKIESK